MNEEKQTLLEHEEVPSGYEGPPPPYAESSYLQAYPLAPQEPHIIAYPPQTISPPACCVQDAVQEQRLRRPPENYYTFSLLLSLLYCLVFAPYLLICTIPALIKAKESRRAADTGDYITAKKKAKQALNLNIASIITGIALLVIFTFVLPFLAAIIVPLALIFAPNILHD